MWIWRNTCQQQPAHKVTTRLMLHWICPNWWTLRWVWFGFLPCGSTNHISMQYIMICDFWNQVGEGMNLWQFNFEKAGFYEGSNIDSIWLCEDILHESRTLQGINTWCKSRAGMVVCPYAWVKHCNGNQQLRWGDGSLIQSLYMFMMLWQNTYLLTYIHAQIHTCIHR